MGKGEARSRAGCPSAVGGPSGRWSQGARRRVPQRSGLEGLWAQQVALPQRATADNPVIPHADAGTESPEDVAHFTQWLEGLKKK